MSTGAVGIAGLAAVWMLLWSRLSPATAVVGMLLAVGALWLQRRHGPGEGRVYIRPLATIRFAAFFITDLVRASVDVTRRALSPTATVRPAIVRLPVRLTREGLITVVANVVSLTPGSVTVDLERDPWVLHLHLLHLEDAAELRSHVRRLERLTADAFGSREDRRAVQEEAS